MSSELEPQEQQRKRSKRHRMKRNNISAKALVDCVKEFGVYARDVERRYRARYRKQESTSIFVK